MLNTGPTLVFCCSSSCRRCCSIPFSTKQRLYEQGDGMIMSLIFKAARLVNALIFMYTAESIGFALSHYSNKLWHNFHMNLHFYSLFFFFFLRERLCELCISSTGRSEIRLELARIQCLAQRHLSRLGECYCRASSTATMPCNPNTDS